MPRRVLEGKVVSDKMDKSITVLVTRRFMHPLYKKFVRKTKKYTAHDENNSFKSGDLVQIIECKPISKRKSWTVVTGDEPKKTEAKKPAAKKAEPKKAEAKKPAAKKTAAKKTAAKKAPAKKAPAKKTTAKKSTAKKKDDK